MIAADAKLYEMDSATGGEGPDTVPSARRFEIPVTEKTADDLETIVGAWLNPADAESSWKLLPGGWIAVSIDQAGYPVVYELRLQVEQNGEQSGLNGTVRKVPLNEPPQWKRTVPDNVLPFEHVLTFLKANR